MSEADLNFEPQLTQEELVYQTREALFNTIGGFDIALKALLDKSDLDPEERVMIQTTQRVFREIEEILDPEKSDITQSTIKQRRQNNRDLLLPGEDPGVWLRFDTDSGYTINLNLSGGLVSEDIDGTGAGRSARAHSTGRDTNSMVDGILSRATMFDVAIQEQGEEKYRYILTINPVTHSHQLRLQRVSHTDVKGNVFIFNDKIQVAQDQASMYIEPLRSLIRPLREQRS